MIQGAFTSDDAVDTEGAAAETHYTYFPSAAVGDGAGGTTSGSTTAVVTTQGSEALLGQATPPSTGEQLQKDGGLRGQPVGSGWGRGAGTFYKKIRTLVSLGCFMNWFELVLKRVPPKVRVRFLGPGPDNLPYIFTGQFFVMMSPQEVLQGGSQRSIAPRTHPYSP